MVKGRRNVLGQGMTEYAIIVALIAISGITVFSYFGGVQRSQVAAITQELAGQESGDMLELAGSYASRAGNAARRDSGLGDYYSGSSGDGSGSGSGSGGSGGDNGDIGGGWTPPGGGGGGWTPPGWGIDPPGGGMCPATAEQKASGTMYVWAASEETDCDDPPEWQDRELDDKEKKALKQDVDNFNKLVSELDYFDTAEDAAKWLHEHGWFLTQKHGAEVASQIFRHTDNNKFSVGKVVTSYHTAKVKGNDLEGSSAYKSPSDAVLHADWHTHPNVGSDGFSLGDYQHRQRRFVSYQRGPGILKYGTSLKYYDGIAAWNEYGSSPSPALELPEALARNYVKCIQGYCL